MTGSEWVIVFCILARVMNNHRETAETLGQ